MNPRKSSILKMNVQIFSNNFYEKLNSLAFHLSLSMYEEIYFLKETSKKCVRNTHTYEVALITKSTEICTHTHTYPFPSHPTHRAHRTIHHISNGQIKPLNNTLCHSTKTQRKNTNYITTKKHTFQTIRIYNRNYIYN